MIILDTAEILEEEMVEEVTKEIIEYLRSHNLSIAAAKYVLETAKSRIEIAKV